MRLQQQQELIRQQQELARQQQHAASNAERARVQAEQERIRREMEEQARQLAQQNQQKEQKRQQYLGRLQTYRDREIAAQYGKLIIKLRLNENMKAHIQGLKKELLSESFWQTTDTRLMVGTLAINVNAFANLMQDLIVETPGINYTREIVDDMLVKGELDLVDASDVIRQGVILDKLTSGSKLLQLANNFTAFGYRLSRNVDVGSDHKALRKEVNVQIKAMDKQIEKYEKEITNAKHSIRAKQILMQSIDAYLKINGSK
jgi:hypothetical protein